MKSHPCLVLLFTAVFLLSVKVSAEEYFLSKNGNDSDPGTEQQPFATLEFSLTKLEPGDILNIREGIYYEDSLTTSIKGTAGEPIVIQAYPGEKVSFEAGFPWYRDVPNNEWELVDAGKNLYRSRRHHRGGWCAAWLIEADARFNNVKDAPFDVRLLTYQTMQEITSSVCQGFHYLGPGIAEDDSGYIFIRLEQCPDNLVDENGNQMEPIPANTNPNEVPIAVSKSTFILRLDGAEYVEIRNIDFHHATNMTDWHHKADGTFDCGYHPFIQSIGNIDISDGSHHITIENSEIIYGNLGLTVNGNAIETGLVNANCHRLVIKNCHIYQGMPDWLVWRDVKGGTNQAWPEFNSFAFSGELINSQFNDNMVHHTLDGLYIKNGSRDSEVRGNYIWWTRDDAINFESFVDNLNVCYNILRHVYEGISVVGYPYPLGSNGGIHGDIFIHHNVIDVTRYMRRDRDKAKIYDQGKVWGAHSCNNSIGGSNPCPYNVERFGVVGDCRKGWTVYNNTIIALERTLTSNQNLYPTGCKHFKNNIVYVIDDMQYPGCNYCDGNIYWRAVGKSTNPDANGASIDPHFNSEILKGKDYSPDIFEYYKPLNPDVLTPGVSLPASFPDSQNDYRGAFGSLRAGGCFAPNDPGVRDIEINSAVLFWRKAESALNYDIRYRKKSGDIWNEVFDIADTLVLIEDLFQNKIYEWGVRSSCPEGNSLYTDGPDFKTLPDNSIPFVTIMTVDSVAAEEDQIPGSISLIRDGTVGELTVYLQISGTMSVDDIVETLPDSVLFVDGDSLIRISITPVDDIRYEGDETCEISIKENYRYNRTVPFTSVIEIQDNDQEGVEIAFVEQAGEVVIEAEHFHEKNNGFDPNIYGWLTEDSTPGYVGAGYLAVPTEGGTVSWFSACEAMYRIGFSTIGTYNVWLRRYAPTAAMNSVWIGMDNVQAGGHDDQSVGLGEWTWVRIDGIDVGTAGYHNFQIRRREVGYQIDRIILRTSGEEPVGDGPSESGEEICTSVAKNTLSENPRQFELFENYPNPFNPSTILRYQIPEKRHVKLVIYNILGHTVRTLVNEIHSVGTYTVEWDGKDQTGVQVSSGIYICKMEAGEFKKSIELMLLK